MENTTIHILKQFAGKYLLCEAYMALSNLNIHIWKLITYYWTPNAANPNHLEPWHDFCGHFVRYVLFGKQFKT
jgi:hypothetical protein